jgi:MYXO-CTERM domain-containing protein
MRISGPTIAVFVLAMPISAHAADLYVDAAAPGGGDGTAAMPLQQIQAALDLAQPGDIVHVADGTYAPLQSVRDGDEAGRITIVADNPRGAIVEATGTALRIDHAYHTFDGLVFDGGYGTTDAVIADGDHAEYLDVEVRRSGKDCIDLRIAEDVLIEGCYIHHCIALDMGMVDDGHGITGDSVFGLTVRDTTIHMASGDSVQLSPPREPWGDVLIEGCTFSTAPLDDADAGLAVGTPVGENALDTKVADDAPEPPRIEVRDTVAHGFVGFIDNQAAFLLKEGVDAFIDGVTVYDSEIGFRLRGPAQVVVHNAVVWGVDNVIRYEDELADAQFLHATIGESIGADVFEDGGGGGQTGMVLDNVLVFGDALPPLLEGTSSMTATADAFVDAAAHDYRLVQGAAAIDAGAMLADVTIDRNGTARPDGAGWDVGAFEYSLGAVDDTGTATTADTGSADGSDSGSASMTGGSASSGAATTMADDSGTGGSGEGTGGSDDSDGGCGCHTTPTPVSLLGIVAFALVRRRRLLARR